MDTMMVDVVKSGSRAVNRVVFVDNRSEIEDDLLRVKPLLINVVLRGVALRLLRLT